MPYTDAVVFLYSSGYNATKKGDAHVRDGIPDCSLTPLSAFVSSPHPCLCVVGTVVQHQLARKHFFIGDLVERILERMKRETFDNIRTKSTS